MTKKHKGAALAACVVLAIVGCAHITEAEKAREEANATGKYKVRLTDDAEYVQGMCKFVHSIIPDMDPLQSPTKAQVDDYYRVEGVLMGADTVLVSSRTTGAYRTGEAYLCGPTPLNPDGSPRAPYATITPGAH